MTKEQLSAKQASMSNADLIEKVETKITNLCRTGGKSFRMSVPPKVDDADMLLSEMVRRFKGTILSTPTDTALAEDVWGIVEGIIGRCTCDIAYVSRQMTDPNCSWCDYHVDLIKAMTTYAAPILADVERVRWEKELVMRQLSAANQRIAEMEKQIESNKKALASNGTISGTGTARFSARTNSLRSMYSKRLPGIGK